MSDDTPNGKIITFYSYKGGTGRSMALANVAWILASAGKRVLTVDWDLEAPGLHRYFRPFLLDKELTSSEGVIDMVLEYAVEALTPIPEDADKSPDWHVPYADILRYATSLSRKFPRRGRLDFVPAGRQTISYATRMNSFDWRNFYERLGGGTFLDEVIKRMRNEYDYVLIDSRTGVSDTSGICTVKMPDALVVCFTLNNQSIEGAASVAASVAAQREGQRVAIFPVPMRIEQGEKIKLDRRMKRAREIFGAYPSDMLEDERAKYLEDVKVNYVPFYAYEEVLAAFIDTPGGRDTVLSAMERLTSYLTDGAVRSWEAPSEEEREDVRARFQGDAPPEEEEPAAAAVAIGPGPDTVKRDIPEVRPPDALRPTVVDTLFYAYAHKDEQLVRGLETHLALLKRMGVISEWHDRKVGAGREWAAEIDEHLNAAKIILLLISPDFLASDYCYDIEVKRALERHEAGEARVIPVILRSTDWKGAPFSNLQALPSNAKPVTSWADRDEAFLNIAQGIRKAAEESVTSAVAAHAAAETASLYIPRPPVVGYVARRDEQGRDIIELLREELTPEKGQVVALWGPGGSGKTVIAAETARSLLGAYAQRVVWVSSIGRSDFTLSTLLDELATQLGRPDLRTLAPLPKSEQVRVLAAHPPTLVVLDNFETISAEEQVRCLDFLTQRAVCPALVTTRSLVNRDDVYNVTLAAMTMEEARDFLQRLAERTRRPSNFDRLDRDDLIRRCEANPLVLQWVVRQIDLAKRPQDVLNDLAQGAGDAAEGVFTRSFNLPQVGDDGRAALLALSLFTPLASRESLAEVSGFAGDLRRLNKAIENLSALWLVETTEGNERLFLRGLTRELAKSRLSKDERADEFQRRYVEHFLRYAEAHAQPTPEDLDALEAEKDNVLGAMDAAFGMQDWEGVMKIRGALNEFLDLRGYWDEAVRSGEQAGAAAREAKNDEGVAYFTACVAMIRRDRGEYEAAGSLYRESLEISRRLGSERNIAVGLHQLGVIAQEQGNFVEARRLYEESLEINQRLGNQGIIAATFRQLGIVARQLGELAEARRLYEKSLEINKRLGDQIGVSRTLNELGLIVQEEGRFDVARHLFSESLEISKTLGDQQGIAITLHQLGLIAEVENNKMEAAGLIREALTIFEKLGSPYAEESRRALSRIEGVS